MVFTLVFSPCFGIMSNVKVHSFTEILGGVLLIELTQNVIGGLSDLEKGSLRLFVVLKYNGARMKSFLHR